MVGAMKSTIASLRELTLPFGATSGGRIVLDGTNGTILMYDTNGDLFMLIEPTLGLVFVDPDLDTRLAIGAESGNYTVITFRDSNGDNPARLYYGAIPGSNNYRHVTLSSPEVGVTPFFQRLLMTTPYPSGNLTDNPLFQVDTGFLNPSGAQPIIDLTGFSDPALEAIVAVGDIKLAASQGAGNAPVLGGSYPRGIIVYAETNSDINFSLTTNAQTTLIETAAVNITAGRHYKITFTGADNILFGGSGQAIGDTARVRLERGISGVYQALASQVSYRNVTAAANRYPFMPLTWDYTPTGNATVSWRVRGTRTVGAGTVQVSMANDGGNNMTQLFVEDMGDAA
jgi:hypothetical protein